MILSLNVFSLFKSLFCGNPCEPFNITNDTSSGATHDNACSSAATQMETILQKSGCASGFIYIANGFATFRWMSTLNILIFLRQAWSCCLFWELFVCWNPIVAFESKLIKIDSLLPLSLNLVSCHVSSFFFSSFLF